MPAAVTYRPKRQHDANFFVHAEGRAKIHIDHGKKEQTSHLNGH